MSAKRGYRVYNLGTYHKPTMYCLCEFPSHSLASVAFRQLVHQYGQNMMTEASRMIQKATKQGIDPIGLLDRLAANNKDSGTVLAIYKGDERAITRVTIPSLYHALQHQLYLRHGTKV